MIKLIYEATTGHITEADNELLKVTLRRDAVEAGFWSPLRIVSHQYGWFINLLICQDDPETLVEFWKLGFSQDFIHLIEMAVYEKCDWLYLDRDAACDSGIPCFDW